jgi:hypothetical protein
MDRTHTSAPNGVGELTLRRTSQLNAGDAAANSSILNQFNLLTNKW